MKEYSEALSGNHFLFPNIIRKWPLSRSSRGLDQENFQKEVLSLKIKASISLQDTFRRILLTEEMSVWSDVQPEMGKNYKCDGFISREPFLRAPCRLNFRRLRVKYVILVIRESAVLPALCGSLGKTWNFVLTQFPHLSVKKFGEKSRYGC